jgi:hypothetical protein
MPPWKLYIQQHIEYKYKSFCFIFFKNNVFIWIHHLTKNKTYLNKCLIGIKIDFNYHSKSLILIKYKINEENCKFIHKIKIK